MEKEIINFEENNLFIRISNVSFNENTVSRKMHNHRAVEFVKVNEGFIYCHLKDKTIKVCKNQVLIINAYAYHSLQSPEKSEINYMQIDVYRHLTQTSVNQTTFFDLYTSLKTSLDFYLSSDLSLINLFNNFNSELTNKLLGYEYYIKGYVFELIAFMQRQKIITLNNFSLSQVNKLLPVINYIDANYDKKISLDELSELIFTDKYSLCRLFKKLTNSTVVDYINFVKIQMAEEMLLCSEKSITEIAFACGFSSMQHFNKVFKTYFDIPPTAFKKQLKSL